MGSTISRNPGLSRWYTGQVVENAAKGGADDWTYHWISLKVLSLEDILQAVQASRPFGKLIPQDRIHDVVRVSQQDARRLGEILTGPNGVEANTLLCAAGAWSQLLHDEDKMRLFALLHINMEGVLAVGDIVLMCMRVLEALSKLRGAPDRVSGVMLESTIQQVVHSVRTDARVAAPRASYITVDEFVIWALKDATVRPILAALKDRGAATDVVPHAFVLPGRAEPRCTPFPVDSSIPPEPPTVERREKSRKGKGPKATSPDARAPEAEEPTIVMDALDEEEDKPPQEVAGSVPVDVLVDCGLLDPAYAAQMYGSDVDLSTVTVTKEEYLRDLCPPDPDVQAFCANAFEQLGSSPPEPVNVVESDESALLSAKEEAIRHEIVSLGERIAELKAQRDRAAEHRSKQEEAATLMQMKLTAVRMELKEIALRLPRNKLRTGGSDESMRSTASSSMRFKSRVERAPLLPLSASMPVMKDVSAVDKKPPDQSRKRAPGLKLNPSSRGEAHGLNIFDEYKTKDKRKSDGAFLADQYLRDDAVQTFKKETKRKGVQFHSWLSEQSGDHLSDLGTKFTDYAHEMWLKRQEGAPWLKPIENPDVYYKTQFENSEQLLKRSTDRHAKLGGQDSVQYYDRIEAERQAERQEAERQRAIDRSKRAQQGPLQGAGRSALQGASPIV